MTQLRKSASWLEIDASSLKHNSNALAQHIGPSVQMGAMLKANAYGHGIPQVIAALHDSFSVFYTILVSDALKIRAVERTLNKARKRVLVVGSISVGDIADLVENDIEVAITEQNWLEKCNFIRFREVKKKLKVHLFLDTGLGREGIRWDDAATQLRYLKEHRDHFEVVGVMTHFADAECKHELAYARIQLDNFKAGVNDLKANGLISAEAELHASASSPALVFPDARFDTVRFGLATYGYWTANESRLATIGDNENGKMQPLDLRPALQWKAQSICVKTLGEGESIGYNRSFICQKPTKIAVFPVGYFDGYPYASQAPFFVLVKGRQCRVLGCVMMNNIVVDISDIATDDEESVTATLLGRDGDACITADDLARTSKSINYHILSMLGSHLERILINQGT